jgi:hypothetical protein
MSESSGLKVTCPEGTIAQRCARERVLIDRAAVATDATGGFSMTKRRIVCWFVTVIAGVGLAAAQDSKAASGKATPDPGKAATKPLTPKSAMPQPHKSTAVVPNASSSGRTTAELNHLAQQPIKSSSAKNSAAGARVAPVKSANASAGSGPKINATYRKPVGGVTAINSAGNARNSSTPRVNKPN